MNVYEVGGVYLSMTKDNKEKLLASPSTTKELGMFILGYQSGLGFIQHYQRCMPAKNVEGAETEDGIIIDVGSYSKFLYVTGVTFAEMAASSQKEVDKMSNIWITSDLHLGHDKPFVWEARGFNSVHEHDWTLIKNINTVVKPDDILYILGDLMLNDNAGGINWIKQITCRHIRIALGNHDSLSREEMYRGSWNVEAIEFAYRLKHGGLNFFLTHYPTLTANGDDNKPLRARIINVCGHRHVTDRWADIGNGLIYHVETDCQGLFPISADEMVADIKGRFI